MTDVFPSNISRKEDFMMYNIVGALFNAERFGSGFAVRVKERSF